jgi:hypothetical protein
MGDVRVISTAHALCGSHAFRHNSQFFITQRYAFSGKSPVSLVSADGHSTSILVAVIPLSHRLLLNTLKYLGASTAKNAQDWSQEIVQASWLGLRVLATVHRTSDAGALWRCRESEVMPHHAWTTCAGANEEAQVPTVLINHSPEILMVPWTC